jgi:hypothetical protein
MGAERLFVDAASPVGMPLREQSSFSPVEVPFVFWSFVYGYSLGPSLRSLHLDRSFQALLPHAPVIGIGIAAVATAAIVGFRDAVRRGRGSFLLSVIGVPLVLSVFLALREIKTFHPRYLVVFFPVFLALLAHGWSGRGRLVRGSALVAALLIVVSLANHFFHPAYGKEDCRSAARLILENERPGDAVVVIYAFRPFRYYFADAADGKARLLHVHKRFLRTDEEMRTHVAEAREHGGRVWLVLTRWWDVAPESRIRRIFEETLREEGRWEYTGVKVLLYEGRTA